MGREKLGGEQAWEVEAILDERKSTRWKCTEFLIKWRGYSHNDNSWEPEHGIACEDLLQEFRAKKKRQQAPQKKKKEEGKTPSIQPTPSVSPAKPISTPTKPPASDEDPEATDDDEDKVIVIKKKKKAKPEATTTKTPDEKKKRKAPEQNGGKTVQEDKARKKVELSDDIKRTATEGASSTPSSSSSPSSASSNTASAPSKASSTSTPSTKTSAPVSSPSAPAKPSTAKTPAPATDSSKTTKDSSKKKKKKQYTPEELARKEAKREKKRRKLAKREAEAQAKLKAAKEEKPTLKVEKREETKPKTPVKIEPPKPIKKLPPTNLCSVCRDRDENPVIACQRCGVEVHPGCYGVQSVSLAEWKCAVCEHVAAHPKQVAEARCCLCPNLVGALKPTTDNRWAHSACALWIPETSFGNNDTLEPVMGLNEIPKERWDLTCCICNKTGYCCIQCDFGTCCESFHVTCAQDAGLRVEFVPVKTDEATPSMTALAYCREHGTSKSKMEDDETESDEDDERDENAKLIDRLKDANSVESREAILDILSSLSSDSLQYFCRPFVEADGLAVFATWMDEGLRDIAAIKRGEKVGYSLDTLIMLERQILKTLKKLWELEKYESALLRQQRLISQTSQLARSDRAPDGELAGLAHSLYYRWTGERLEVQSGTPYVVPRSRDNYEESKRISNNRAHHQREKPKNNRFFGKDVDKMDGFGGYHKSNRDNDYRKPRDNNPPPRNYYNNPFPSTDGYAPFVAPESYHNKFFPGTYAPPSFPPSAEPNPYYNNFSVAPPLPNYYPPPSLSSSSHPSHLPVESAPPPPPVRMNSLSLEPPTYLPPVPADNKPEPKLGKVATIIDGPLEEMPKVSSWPPKRAEPMPSCLKPAKPRNVSVQWANEDSLCEWIEFTAAGRLHGLKIKKKEKKVRAKKVLRVGTPVDAD